MLSRRKLVTAAVLAPAVETLRLYGSQGSQIYTPENKMPIMNRSVMRGVLHQSSRLLQGVGSPKDAYDAFSQMLFQLDAVGILDAMPRNALPAGDARILGDAMRATPTLPFTSEEISELQDQMQKLLDSSVANDADILAAVDKMGGWRNVLTATADMLYDCAWDNDLNAVPALRAPAGLRRGIARPRATLSSGACFYAGWAVLYVGGVWRAMQWGGAIATIMEPEVVAAIGATLWVTGLVLKAMCP